MPTYGEDKGRKGTQPFAPINNNPFPARPLVRSTETSQSPSMTFLDPPRTLWVSNPEVLRKRNIIFGSACPA